MSLEAPQIGYAVANSAEEHQALTARGYGPAYVGAETALPAGDTIESVREKLDALGIAYDKRWGLSRLLTLVT